MVKFLALPHTILENILGYLRLNPHLGFFYSPTHEGTTALLQCAQVCKALSEYALDELYRNIEVEGFHALLSLLSPLAADQTHEYWVRLDLGNLYHIV